MEDNFFAVQVCYAATDRQELITIRCAPGTSIAQVIEKSGFMQRYALDWNELQVGVFSKLKKLQDGVRAGDRVEIYRPLRADPKEARRRRAQQK